MSKFHIIIYQDSILLTSLVSLDLLPGNQDKIKELWHSDMLKVLTKTLVRT